MTKPKHIAIIPDGNRRFAHASGHAKGVKKANELLKWSVDKKIENITFFALSAENYSRRSKKELNKILNLLRKEMDSILDGDHVVCQEDIRVKFIGRLHELPSNIQNKIIAVQDKTRKNDSLFLRIALNYGGRQELVDAAKNVKIKNLNTINFYDHLYDNEAPDPDVFIRTGGKKRLSNFLLYQLAYTELFFLDKLFPELEEKDLDKILNKFKNIKRNYGK